MSDKLINTKAQRQNPRQITVAIWPIRRLVLSDSALISACDIPIALANTLSRLNVMVRLIIPHFGRANVTACVKMC